MQLFTIQGNIGSGKTTFAQNLKTYLETRFKSKVLLIKEPIDKWINVGGLNLLQMFYDHPEKWALSFQINALLDMIQSKNMIAEFLVDNENGVVIMERNSYSVTELFTPLLLQMNILTDTEALVVQRVYSALKATDSKYSTCETVFYIRSEPNICFERMQKRSRKEEIGKVSIEYLESLHAMHERKLGENNLGAELNLWIVNGNTVDEHDISNADIQTSNVNKFKIDEIMSTMLFGETYISTK